MTTGIRAGTIGRGRVLSGLWGRMLLAVVLSAAVVALPQRAEAQGGRRVSAGMRAGPGGMGNTAITSREVDKWVEILELSPEQADAVKALHDAYREEHRVETKALQDLIKNAQQDFMESQDTSAFKDIASKSAAHTEKLAALDKQFMADVQAVLEPRQAATWPRVERYHRRVKSLPAGMLAGESVNLVSITDDLGLSEPSQELRDALDQYEIDLDKALTERDTLRKQVEKRGEEMMKDFDPSKMDFTKIREMMQETRKAGVPVREVNQRHARLIAGVVPEPKRADFEDRVRRATYPSVYREPYTGKALAAAKAFDDLTPEQKESLRTLETSYTRDLAAANERWAAAVAQEEKDGGGDPFMGFGRFVPGGGDAEKSPTEEARAVRRDLDKATLDKLKAVLTPDQQERLPEREVDNPWMMNFGGGGEDADEDAKPAKSDKKGR